MESFDETYRHMYDEELLDLASEARDLLPAAERSLWAELNRRGLGEEANRRKRDSQARASAHQPPPDLSNLIPVYSAENEIEGRVLQDLLREAGMESLLRQQVVSTLFPAACEILVLASEEHKARRLIEEYQKSRSLPEEETEATDESSSGES